MAIMTLAEIRTLKDDLRTTEQGLIDSIAPLLEKRNELDNQLTEVNKRFAELESQRRKIASAFEALAEVEADILKDQEVK